MSKFESSIKVIPYSQQTVYNTLSDLTNVERIKDKIPQDKLEGLTFDRDSISMSMKPVGQVSMRIVNREEPKTIKFQSENSPLSFFFWIQLLPVRENCGSVSNDTLRRLTRNETLVDNVSQTISKYGKQALGKEF